MRTICWALCLALGPLPAFGEIDVHSGNRWLPLCQSENALCTGYIAALVDTHGMHVRYGRPSMWCAPDNVTYGQVMKVVVAHLVKNPQQLHFPFSDLATVAMMNAFPCGKGKK
ncbi:MAG: Rap1a/Tai family immunity protein [Hyphomicrobiaceae bacterium]